MKANKFARKPIFIVYVGLFKLDISPSRLLDPHLVFDVFVMTISHREILTVCVNPLDIAGSRESSSWMKTSINHLITKEYFFLLFNGKPCFLCFSLSYMDSKEIPDATTENGVGMSGMPKWSDPSWVVCPF